MEELCDRTVKLIQGLPESKLKEAYSFISYLNDKEEWEATMELNYPEILTEIKNGIDEIKSGQYINFNSIRRNV